MATVLLISPEPWSHIFVSKHHYALELASRGYKVFFVNPPDPEHFPELTLTELPGNPNIVLVDYPGQLKGLRYFPTFLRIKLNKLFLARVEKLSGCVIDIVWNFENSRFFDMQFGANRLKIYHQVDLNQTFNLKETAQSADICFGTTDFICNAIRTFAGRVYKIHHGTAKNALDFPYKINAASSSPIIATYIGNLEIPYLDLNLMKSLVLSFPHIQFRFIGPYTVKGNAFRTLSTFSNVEWIGTQPADKIPSFLNDSDIFLVVYKEEYHNNQVASPHKFMEYFSSGRVIVATYTDEYKDKDDLLAMSQRQEEYLQLFQEVTEHLASFNSQKLQENRKAFAEEHAYSRQVDKIISYCRQNNLYFPDEQPVIHQQLGL
jgi:hypothetical protein